MKLIATTAIVLGMVTPTAAMAAGDVTSATATASAEIMKPLSLACETEMQFGEIISPTAATTVTMPANGEPIRDPGNIVLPGSRDFATPASCIASGQPNYSFTVSLPSNPQTLSSNGHTMILDNFTIQAEVDGNPFDRRLSAGAGTNSFGIGARLSVNANQEPGLYTGTFPVIVEYN